MCPSHLLRYFCKERFSFSHDPSWTYCKMFIFFCSVRAITENMASWVFFRHKIMCFKEIFLCLVYMYVVPNNLLCECWSTKIPWKKQVTLGQNWVNLTFFCHLPSLFLITYVAVPPIGGISHKKSYGQYTMALFLPLTWLFLWLCLE